MNYVDADVRDQLAHAGSAMVRAGLVVGSGGNLSARGPDEDQCWITAAGAWLDRLERSSFVRVRVDDGAVVRRDPAGNAGMAAGAAAEPSSELALHLAIYRTRPDVNAVVHLHPQTVLLLDALGERIRLVTTDHAFYLRRIGYTAFQQPGSAEVATAAAKATTTGTDCVVLSHHGVCVLGPSVELAHKRADNLEEAARLTYRALAAGVLDRLPECPSAFTDRLTGGAQVAI